MLPSQSVQPVWQTAPQAYTPAWSPQAATVCGPVGAGQVVPQLPQFVRVETMVSQPFVALPSQFPKLGLQVLKAHVPAEQTGVALLAAQMCPQTPQFGVDDRMSVSQPSAALPLQSAKPVEQAAMVQAPTVQPAVAFGRVQAWPQVPQLVAVVRRSTSQPFPAAPSQSAKFALQVKPQLVPLHVALAFAGTVHGAHDDPQLAVLVDARQVPVQAW